MTMFLLWHVEYCLTCVGNCNMGRGFCKQCISPQHENQVFDDPSIQSQKIPWVKGSWPSQSKMCVLQCNACTNIPLYNSVSSQISYMFMCKYPHIHVGWVQGLVDSTTHHDWPPTNNMPQVGSRSTCILCTGRPLLQDEVLVRQHAISTKSTLTNSLVTHVLM